jgi:hypothetical protein
MIVFLAVGLCAVVFSIIIIVWERSWMSGIRLILPADDELYYALSGANFLPEKLHYGAEVVRGDVAYQVCGITVATIGDERWLLYDLKTSDAGQEAALGVNVRGRQLHLRWWSYRDDLSQKFMNQLLATEAATTKLDDRSYIRASDGYAPFVSLGSTKYPLKKLLNYSLFQSGDQSLESLTSCYWLLSLGWEESRKNLLPEKHRELLIGEDMEVGGIVIHSCEDSELPRPPRRMEFDDAVRATKVRRNILFAAPMVVCFIIVAVFIF